ncbi:DMT family transporter [Allorhizocola rhizosphaerae]|uniref:DMT family transporter n=1 Tax=Allorhizocola rhizosphaerae TaxID=1872709 RepID=UPI000E3CCAFA|nr:DMT family transporter [Allorhizocola rhizosphaerae]
MRSPSAPDKWIPAFLANAVIWGASFIFIKIGVSKLHPTWVGAGRLIVGALALLAILLITRERLPRDRRLWLHMLVPGIIGSAIPFALFAYGEERVSSIVAGIWNATAALWVLPFAVLVYRIERFTARGAIGLTLGFGGVLTVLGFWDASASSIVGQLMCGVAALCYGVAIPYLKRYVTGRSSASGVALAAVQVIIAAIASTIAALILAGPPPAPTTWGWDVIGSILALGAFGSGVAFALNMRVISMAGASTASYVTYLIPVVATVLGILVLGESLTWNQPVGALIVLTGVAIAQGLLSRKPKPPTSATAPPAVKELAHRR